MKTALRKAMSLLLAVMMIFGTAAVGITYVGYAEEECEPESSKDVWEDEEVPTLNPGNPDRHICNNFYDVYIPERPPTLPGEKGKLNGDYNEGNYGYNVVDNKAVIVDASVSGDVTVPSSLGGYEVTAIGETAFARCGYSLSSITIPDGIVSIGRNAFYHCYGLKKVTISDSVTSIANGAFDCCHGLENIYIPKNVSKIGHNPFFDCVSLKEITVDPENKYYTSDENGVLFNKNKTELISYPAGNEITSYTIPDGVTAINSGAFISADSLVSVTVPGGITSIPNNLFVGCSSLVNVKILTGVTEIGEYVFKGCTSLTNITIPDSVTSIGYHMFENCKSLTNIIIPDSVTSIDTGAFRECSSLKSITISGNVTSIGGFAFYGCNSLTDVYFNGTEAQWKAITIIDYNENLTNATIHYGIHNVNWNVDGKQTTQEVKVGSKIIPPANPTKSGYVFKGWSPSVPATMPAKDMTFTAVFEKAVYNVTWVVDGAKTTHKYEFGAKITTPANPTKSGYVFKGWSPSVPATMPAKDMTFTAVFEIDSSKFIATDRFWFGNSSKHFVTSWSNNAYYISDADMNKLANYIKKYEYRPNSTISSIQRLKNSEWGGSCYGMAAVVLLDKSNAIAFNENFGNGAKSMCEVASPNTSKTIMSAINYYMLSQKINFIDYSSYYYSSSNSNWSQGLKKLVETAKAGKPFLFCYYFDRGGHAIVAYDYKLAADGSHNIITYDNRYPNKDLIIVIDKNYKTSTLVTPGGNEKMLGVEFYPDMKAFDKIDIDGPANDMKITYSDYSYSSSNHTIEILAEGNVTVTNEEGKTLTYSNGVVGGDMNVISTHMIVNSTEDGNPAAPTLVFEVSPSGSFTFESSSDEMSASVMSDTMYASADSKNADCIVIGNDEGVYVMGEDIEYNATLSSKNEGYDTINIDGEATKDISLTYNKNDVVASGVNGSNGNVSVYSNVINVDSYKYKSGYNDIMIASDGKDNGDIDILGSKDNGETFGASVKIDESALNVDIRTPSTTSITYGDSIVLHADVENLPEGAKIVWTADNANFTYNASADGSTCTVSPSANGDTTFTATVVDANGNEIGSDTQSMTSKAGFFQKIIAFFKNLFGLTKVIPEVFEF